MGGTAVVALSRRQGCGPALVRTRRHGGGTGRVAAGPYRRVWDSRCSPRGSAESLVRRRGGRMTPETFVAALKASVRKGAESEVKYFARPPSPDPPAHLARFSAWYRRLSPSDRKVAREVIRYAAEGSLFGLLTALDNM